MREVRESERQSNFELLKIIAMLMIVAHHFVAKNGFNVDTEITGISFNKLFLQYIGNHAFIGNNLFFMVTAWFLCGTKPSFNWKNKMKKIWALEQQMLFYSVGLFLVFRAAVRGGGDSWTNNAGKVIVSPQHGIVVVSDNLCSVSVDSAVLSKGSAGIV
jgi:peptidoglycan/LPS O-acetylase OafA/YrhL